MSDEQIHEDAQLAASVIVSPLLGCVMWEAKP